MHQQQKLLAWVERRIDAMLARPRAWGGGEAVETQILLLLQFRALLARPSATKIASTTLDMYFAYLSGHYPDMPNHPLHQIVGDDPTGENLATELRKAVDALRHAATPENPFEHNRLAIRLKYKEGANPRTSSVTRYFEEFRRAARATARKPNKNSGRASKAIEEATDFELMDVRISRMNGVAVEVLVIMGDGYGQQDFVANDAVREGLSGMLALGEWADRDEGLDGLDIDSNQRRTTLALQTVRVLPRGDIAEAQIGGQLVSRSRPVVYRPHFEARLMGVVETQAPPETFEADDEIRAFDQDRGSLLLGKNRLRCFVRPEFLPSILTVGQNARVTGHLYQPTVGKPFVLVNGPIEGPAVSGDTDDSELA